VDPEKEGLMKTRCLSGIKIVIVVVILLFATTAFDCRDTDYGISFRGGVATVAAQEAVSLPDSGRSSGQSDAYEDEAPASETPVHEGTGTNDRDAYRTPLRILSVMAVALLLAWYIRRRMKL